VTTAMMLIILIAWYAHLYLIFIYPSFHSIFTFSIFSMLKQERFNRVLFW